MPSSLARSLVTRSISIMAKEGVATRARRKVRSGRFRIGFMMLIGRGVGGNVSRVHLTSRKPTEQVPWAFEDALSLPSARIVWETKRQKTKDERQGQTRMSTPPAKGGQECLPHRRRADKNVYPTIFEWSAH